MLLYLLTRLSCLLTRRSSQHAAARDDQGSIALEWIVIGSIALLAALWAAAKITAAIHNHGNPIH